MALQPKSGLGLLYWGSATIMFYGVRLLASRPTPVNFWGTYDFLLGFTPLAKGFSLKALKTSSPSHSHLLHNPLCIAPGPPRGGWEFGFPGRACRLNTQEAFLYLTGHAYSCTWVPGVKRPGRDADHSPSSSAEVENEWELYLPSPQAPLWRVVEYL
jgi:hypothetical protein